MIYDYLLSNDITVATAESCTGGNIAANFVSVPGISKVFLAGFVTYANSSKINVLGVNEKTIKKHGAVSCECALEMLAGAIKKSGADASVCTTGIAGPGGGTKEKPVGLVFVGARYKENSVVKKCFFNGTRDEIINKAAHEALDLLEYVIKREEK